MGVQLLGNYEVRILFYMQRNCGTQLRSSGCPKLKTWSVCVGGGGRGNMELG